MRISDWSSDVCSSDLTANVGDARVKGAEADAWWRPAAGLDIRAGIGFIDTQVTRSVVAGVVKGSVLPNSPRLPITGMAKYERSDERRVGVECVCTSRYRWSRDH